jgi:hypothetical protein
MPAAEISDWGPVIIAVIVIAAFFRAAGEYQPNNSEGTMPNNSESDSLAPFSLYRR